MIVRRLVALLAIMLPAAAAAHDSRPLAIFIDVKGEGRIELAWRTPPSVDPSNAPRISLASPCRLLAAPSSSLLSGMAVYRCDDGALGATLSIRYPDYNPSLSTLVRLRRKSTTTAVLPPEQTQWKIPAEDTVRSVAGSYLKLGVRHIWSGIDHVLFLFGLLVLAGTPRRVLLTVTGFTLAHSVTLALVAFNVLFVSIPAVEATIALSILFVAAEIARDERTTLAWRRPILVASTFGLLHGAGFASALAEIGLPQTEKVAALLSFNLGVEAGQIGLIAAAFAAVAALKSPSRMLPQHALQKLASYALGVPSAFWLFQRVSTAL